jgi:hypothetical protein
MAALSIMALLTGIVSWFVVLFSAQDFGNETVPAAALVEAMNDFLETLLDTILHACFLDVVGST